MKIETVILVALVVCVIFIAISIISFTETVGKILTVLWEGTK